MPPSTRMESVPRQMIESPNLTRAMYAWEREKFADLEIGLTPELARRWFRLLTIEFGLQDHAISFGYYREKHSSLQGQTVVGECPWSSGRSAQIRLYPPHHLRTLGHEFAHVVRCEKEGLHGHGGDWQGDVSKVHAVIRKHLPRLHWCEIRRPA